MHYDIKYKTDGSEDRKACCDVLAYTGARAYKALARVIKFKENDMMIEMMGVMCGVQGFPIQAMKRRYGDVD